MSKTEQRQLQHTVRFRTAEEGSLAALMAASAGVSTSEWVATAAREQMLRWLRMGYNDHLGEETANDYAEILEASLDDAATLDDVPMIKRKRELREAGKR